MLAVLSLATGGFAAEPAVRPDLDREFQTPPPESHPLAWYFWTGDHISQEGLAKDLEAMRQSAIGGGVVMHVGSPTPARTPMPFFQEEWRKAMRHMFTEAERLDLQFGVHNCPGYSAAGGPWVTVEQSQKVLDWTETLVDGPGRRDAPLARPPAKKDFYRDVAVLAYPEQPGGGNLLQRHRDAVKITSGGQSLDVAAFLDRNPSTGSNVSSSEPLRIEFPGPVTLCSVAIHTRGGVGAAPEIAVCVPDTAGGWTRIGGVVFFPNSPPILKTANIAPVTSSVFALEFGEAYKTIPKLLIGELAFHSSPLVLDPAWKAHFTSRSLASGPTWLEENTINRTDAAEAAHDPRWPTLPKPEQVIDLTDKLRPDGTLDWNIPPGAWTLLRFGMTTTGGGPHPSPVPGLEVDKLDARAMRAHLENYMGKIAEDAGPLTGRRFRFSEIDSHEKGHQNWTYDLPEKFHKRWG